MEILGYTLEYPPTSDNYRRETFTVGTQRRTLSGALDTIIRAIKKRWTFTLPEQGLEELLIPYLDGTPFRFVDVDGTEYEAVTVTGVIPVGGYPEIATITVSLEEI